MDLLAGGRAQYTSDVPNRARRVRRGLPRAIRGRFGSSHLLTGSRRVSMPAPNLKERDPLDDFERRDVTLLGQSKLVFVAGSGPAVIVMTEMPGISPEVARFARFVRDAGFTVWMPNLFGDPGRVPTHRPRRADDRARLRQPRVPRLRGQRVESRHAVAARARRARAPALRREGRRRDRHVLHRQLRALDDARAGDARAGAVAAVAADGPGRRACTSRPTNWRR